MNRRVPVILVGNNCLSGVTSWVDQLRSAMAGHPQYDVRTLYVGQEVAGRGDIAVRTLGEAERAIHRLAPAIVVPNYMWSLFLAGFEAGIRCVGMCHSDSPSEYYLPLSWYEPLVDKYIAVSQECDRRLKQYVAHRSADVTTLPYGVNVPGVLSRDYQTTPLRLIYAGRVTQPQKRVWDFLPLVEHLLRARVPFEFTIVGEGDEFGPLQQILRARVPAADVFFHSRVPHAQMAQKWLNHDVFLQVSDFEGTSVSMLEAMAHGAVPVVTAASSGIAGVISNGENGFVVPVGDMAAMALVLSRLAGDKKKLVDAGQAAHLTAQAYSLESYVQKFVAILDTIDPSEERSDPAERYGEFSPLHPLVVQRQQLEKRQAEIAKLERSEMKGFLKHRLMRWRGSKPSPVACEEKRAA